MAFCVLLHSYRPDLVDLTSLRPGDALHNCSLAFTAAEEGLGVTSLLDPQDMRDAPQLDRRSMLTYLSELYHALEGEDGLGRKQSVDSGLGSSSSGQVSPVSSCGEGVRSRGRAGGRRGVRSRCEVEQGGRSMCEGGQGARSRAFSLGEEGSTTESAFTSALRKFSSLSLSQGEEVGGGARLGSSKIQEPRENTRRISWEEGGRLEGGSDEREETKTRERRGGSRELVSRGSQTEESHLRSVRVWTTVTAQPLLYTPGRDNNIPDKESRRQQGINSQLVSWQYPGSSRDISSDSKHPINTHKVNTGHFLKASKVNDSHMVSKQEIPSDLAPLQGNTSDISPLRGILSDIVPHRGITYQSLPSVPAPPVKQRLSQRLERIAAVRRRQQGFPSLQGYQTYSSLGSRETTDPITPSLLHRSNQQFSTLV